MVKKNAFSFTAFAAATCLGLGLLVSGCGDGGSTTPNALDGSTPTPTPPTPAPQYGTVTFNYNVLAAVTAKAADIKADIITVKYAFYGLNEDSSRFVNGPDTDPSYIHTFTHGEGNVGETVTVTNVNPKATRVAATYYDAEGNLIAVGVNDFNFDDNNDAEVTDPEISEVEDIEFVASSHVIGLNEGVILCLVAPIKDAPDGEYFMLTDFADIKGIDSEILQTQSSAEAGLVGIGAKYGIISESEAYAEFCGEKYALDAPIYVTGQTVDSIELIPDKSTPCYGDGTDKVEIMYAPDRDSSGKLINGSLGQKFVEIYPVDIYAPSPYFVAAVNTAPLQVLAVYTNEDGKGPQPQNIDLLQEPDSNFNLGISTTSGDSLLEMDESGSLVLKGINNTTGGFDKYVVTATYGEGDTAIIKTLDVEAADGKPAIAFCNESMVNYVARIECIPQYSWSFNLKACGRLTFGDSLETHPIAIGEDVIAADAYPATMPITPEVDGITLSQNDHLNSYVILAIPYATAGSYSLSLDVGDNLPSFRTTSLKIKELN